MRSKPATRENSRKLPHFGAALLAALIVLAAPPAGAQTATSTSGDVGSGALRNGYPCSGGAIVLPAPPACGNATTATGATLEKDVGGRVKPGHGVPEAD
jgi:hypothetical protein